MNLRTSSEQASDTLLWQCHTCGDVFCIPLEFPFCEINGFYECVACCSLSDKDETNEPVCTDKR